MQKVIMLLLCAVSMAALAAPLPLVTKVEVQPLAAQVTRVAEALAYLGAPLSEAELQRLKDAPALSEAEAVKQIQEVLDRHALFGVNINPEMRVKVAQGEAKPELDEQGWRVFLVKVENEAGTTAPLKAVSPKSETMNHCVDPPPLSSSSPFFLSAGLATIA